MNLKVGARSTKDGKMQKYILMQINIEEDAEKSASKEADC